MNKRIAEIRKHSGLTQEQFGDRIGHLSRNYVWMLERGDRTPSDRTITDICREFNVNENWLRTGDGDKFVSVNRINEISSFMGEILSGESDFRSRFVSVLARLNTDQWKLIEEMADMLVEEMKKEKADQ